MTGKGRFTPGQGQYLAYIHTYSVLHGVAPAEADLQRFFRVSPPAVHDMIRRLERQGLLARIPGQPRSLRVLVGEAELPRLIRPGGAGQA